MQDSKKKKNLERLKPIFWEYEWDSVRKNLTSPVIIAKLLEMANPEQFKIFSSLVGDEEIKRFLEKKGEKRLSKKAYNYWKLYYEKKIKEKS